MLHEPYGTQPLAARISLEETMFNRRKQAEEAAEMAERLQAERRRRQVAITPDAVDQNVIDEITAICAIAVEARYTLGSVDSTTMTQGGLMVEASRLGERNVAPLLRRALEAAGYVLGADPTPSAVIVTGWDPAHYTGPLLTLAAVDDHIDNLLQLRAHLMDDDLAKRT